MYLDQIFNLASKGLKGKLNKQDGNLFLNSTLQEIYNMDLPNFKHTWFIVDTVASPRTTASDLSLDYGDRWTIPLIDAGYQTWANSASSDSATEKFRTVDKVVDSSGYEYKRDLHFDVLPYNPTQNTGLGDKATGNIKNSVIVFKPCFDDNSSFNLDGWEVHGYLNPPKVSPTDWTTYVTSGTSSLELLVPFDGMLVIQGMMATGERFFFGDQTFHQVKFEQMKQDLSDVVNSDRDGGTVSNGEFEDVSYSQGDY